MGGFLQSTATSYPGIFFEYELENDSTDNVEIELDVSSSFSNVQIQESGLGTPHENRPPYYVLAFLMKL
jgi:hypothetical protein